MTEPTPPRGGLDRLLAEAFELFLMYVNWVEQHVKTCLGDAGIDTGQKFAPSFDTPVTKWYSDIAITSPADNIRPCCIDCRQLGGGKPVPEWRITFDPPVLKKGDNDVTVTVDLAGYPVGIWMGTIVSTLNRNPKTASLTTEPIMPTYAG